VPGNGAAFKDGENIFFDPSAENGLSTSCRHFIGGVMKHARALAAITNPTVNSYKRLVPGYEAPVYITWSYRNRSPLIRIPARRGIRTRIELRNPDPTCNPYLGLARILKAGLEGIREQIDPPSPANENIYEMALGEHIYSRFLLAKTREWESYSARVYDWELKEYLGKF